MPWLPKAVPDRGTKVWFTIGHAAVQQCWPHHQQLVHVQQHDEGATWLPLAHGWQNVQAQGHASDFACGAQLLAGAVRGLQDALQARLTLALVLPG
jgi:hypothetical protein